MIQTRLLVAAVVAGTWFIVLAPYCADRIHKATLEGPAPFSVQNVRDGLAETEDTGSDSDEQQIHEFLAQLSTLELAEEERVMAMWLLLDSEDLTKARTAVPQLPPLKYAVDPRFFEPITPSIIRRVIEIYGYSESPLGTATSRTRPADLDTRGQLMILLSAVHHKLLREDEAAKLLSAAIALLDLQMERRAVEGELERFMADSSTN